MIQTNCVVRQAHHELTMKENPRVELEPHSF